MKMNRQMQGGDNSRWRILPADFWKRRSTCHAASNGCNPVVGGIVMPVVWDCGGWWVMSLSANVGGALARTARLIVICAWHCVSVRHVVRVLEDRCTLSAGAALSETVWGQHRLRSCGCGAVLNRMHAQHRGTSCRLRLALLAVEVMGGVCSLAGIAVLF